MRHTNRAVSGAVRYLYDVLASGTLASAFLIGLIHSNVYWSAQFFGWEMGLNQSLHRTYNDPVGYDCAFYVWALAITILVFLLLSVLSRLSLTRKMLRTIAGVIGVAAPLTCLWFVGWYRPDELYSGWTWLRLEGCGAIGCAVLYACNRWPISVAGTIAVLTLHGALWVHAYAATFQIYGSCLLTPPISAYFSTLIWGYYMKGSVSNVAHRGSPIAER